jgi:small subunit ribosomal protein S9
MIIEKSIFCTKNIEIVVKKKCCTSKINIIPGFGNIYINKFFNTYYFENNIYNLNYKINFLFKILNINLIKYDIFININGGGIISQMNNIFTGILKILSKQHKNFYFILLKAHLLYADTRIKERKKFGLKKARKASQYHKR